MAGLMLDIEHKEVATYFKNQSDATREALISLRDCILTVAPKAEELINYRIPAYALVKGGKRDQQIMIAGYANHVGFYPHPITMEHFKEELSGYKTGKGSVQFPLEKPLPIELIKAMVQFRLNMLNRGKSNL
jgi:uncharacterized protein YdhG (YjbR/CyaY superfamily)